MAEIEVVVPGVGNVTINNYRHQQPVECNAVPVDPATAYWFDELHEPAAETIDVKYYSVSSEVYEQALEFEYNQVVEMSALLETHVTDPTKTESATKMPYEVYVDIIRHDRPTPEEYLHAVVTPNLGNFIVIVRDHYNHQDESSPSDKIVFKDASSGTEISTCGAMADVYYVSSNPVV